MFVNGLPFLVTSLRGLSLVTIEHLPSRTAKRLVQTLERVFKIYATAGFFIQTTMMDMEFEKLRPLMPHVALNTTAAREHVGKIEQKISPSILSYSMLVPKPANCQYRYGEAHYQYWYQFWYRLRHT
jgi:hypothetical protein